MLEKSDSAMLLENRITMITGAAQGIGRSIAKRFAEHGAKVLVTDILVDEGQELVEELARQGYRADFAQLDVTDLNSINKALNQCLEAFGGVDILVNNAGINYAATVVDMDATAWERVLAVNLTGAFLCLMVGFC